MINSRFAPPFPLQKPARTPQLATRLAGVLLHAVLFLEIVIRFIDRLHFPRCRFLQLNAKVTDVIRMLHHGKIVVLSSDFIGVGVLLASACFICADLAFQR